MSPQEDFVTIRVTGGGAAAFSAGEKYSLTVAAGELKDKWNDGSPITRAELEHILAPHGPFELAEAAQAAPEPKRRVVPMPKSQEE
ncbi:MAG TPA: hypothetical protein VKQ28_16830 [Candidatus Acidoferrum sp.]|nr:hypothetical protein [Candidatus Acidoferrum sp.]